MEKRTIGIELGSTRIKAVMINEKHEVIASGSYDWENRLENGIWTYHLDDVKKGLQGAYASLAADFSAKTGEELTSVDAIGVSAMMHGYLVTDENDRQLAQFRTWRNTITEQAAEELTELFNFNIPQRWSIAHLYQAILNNEDHVKDIRYMTTLSGYVHWQLTGEKVLGVGDASGMFSIDSTTGTYDRGMIDAFEKRIAEKNFPWKLSQILPKVLYAGEDAGKLTEEGALLLDPTGKLKAGIPLCPPEGDAGTGMVATNAVRQRTGNVSAGTSIFGMVVLERPLSRVYRELDLCTTPNGSPVAMAHCNNCSSDLNAWIGLFNEVLKTFGQITSKNDMYPALFALSLQGSPDAGGLLNYNYFSGEHVVGLNEGRPLFVRHADSSFTLANFMKAQIYSCFGALKTGMDLLTWDEDVALDEIVGHGGLFKTPGVAQRYLAAALNTPVTVMETAGEGGAWGIAVLAMFRVNNIGAKTLPDYLQTQVFADMKKVTLSPDPEDCKGFTAFFERYRSGLAAERAAVENL